MNNKRLQRRIKKILIMLVLLIIIGMLVFISNENSSETEQQLAKTEQQLAKTQTVQRMLEKDLITEEVINKDNSQYDSIQNGNGNIILMEYGGDQDCVIVPKELEGKEITEINPKAFIHNDNLEMIKIPAEISENIDVIDGFEISKDLSNDEYIVYITTKEYTEEYLEYMSLSDEERKEREIIPSKFLVSENQNLKRTRELATAYTSIPSSFDLRKDKGLKITAGNQEKLGICFAYSYIKSAETNVALTRSKEMDFSEIHLAVKSKLFEGAESGAVKSEYWDTGYGPVIERPNTLLNQAYLTNIKNTNNIANNIYQACAGTKTLTTQEIDDAIKELDNLESTQKFYVMSTADFHIPGVYKTDSSKESKITETRNKMKNHIQNYGLLSIGIADPNDSSICGKYGKYRVMKSKARIWSLSSSKYNWMG